MEQALLLDQEPISVRGLNITTQDCGDPLKNFSQFLHQYLGEKQ